MLIRCMCSEKTKRNDIGLYLPYLGSLYLMSAAPR
jgi:hypothetical protein